MIFCKQHESARSRTLGWFLGMTYFLLQELWQSWMCVRARYTFTYGACIQQLQWDNSRMLYTMEVVLDSTVAPTRDLMLCACTGNVSVMLVSPTIVVSQSMKYPLTLTYLCGCTMNFFLDVDYFHLAVFGITRSTCISGWNIWDWFWSDIVIRAKYWWAFIQNALAKSWRVSTVPYILT